MRLAALAALLLTGVVAHAQPAPAARCTALLAGGRALVDVELSGLLDPELLRLVRLGLEGRIRVEVNLLQRQPLWFDALIASQTTRATLHWSREAERFVLDARRELNDPDRITLERLALRPEDPLEPKGQYRVEVKVVLQVVTAASLGQVAAWIVTPSGGEEDRAGTRPAAAPARSPPVPENLLSTLANDLLRTTECRCDAAPPR